MLRMMLLTNSAVDYRSHRLNTALFWLSVKVRIAQIVINHAYLVMAVLLYTIKKYVVGL